MVSNVVITTCEHDYTDTFKYSILDNYNILIERTDQRAGWWFDLNIYIKMKDGETKYVNIGANPQSYYKIITLNFLIEYDYPTLPIDDININKYKNGIIFDSNVIKEKDIIFDEYSNIVIVSGIVYVSKNKLLGSHSRSIFSSEERYEQTIQTLKSIMHYIPNSKIILLEQSKFFPEDKLLNISKYCDYIIHYKNDVNNDYYSNIQDFNKGLGEMYVTNHFLSLIKNKNFNTILKIAARNILTSDFNINNFSKYTTFKVMKGNGRLGIIVFSCVYSIQKEVLNLFIEHQKVWLERNSKEPIEHILTLFAESIPELNLISFLNIKGKGGNSNDNYYL